MLRGGAALPEQRETRSAVAQIDEPNLAKRHRSILRVLIAVLLLDLLMALTKGTYGYLTSSIAMISDGVVRKNYRRGLKRAR